MANCLSPKKACPTCPCSAWCRDHATSAFTLPTRSFLFGQAAPALPVMCEVICLCVWNGELAGTFKREVILASGLREITVWFTNQMHSYKFDLSLIHLLWWSYLHSLNYDSVSNAPQSWGQSLLICDQTPLSTKNMICQMVPIKW